MKKTIFIIPLCILSVCIFGMIISCSKSLTIYIDQSGKKPNPKESFDVHVYMENSGSMDSYMCDGSELKDAVYSYISEINGIAKNLDLNYINSQIIPFNGNLQSYVRNLTPVAFANAGGNRANTVIPNMIDTILCHLNSAAFVLIFFISS